MYIQYFVYMQKQQNFVDVKNKTNDIGVAITW